MHRISCNFTRGLVWIDIVHASPGVKTVPERLREWCREQDIHRFPGDFNVHETRFAGFYNEENANRILEWCESNRVDATINYDVKWNSTLFRRIDDFDWGDDYLSRYLLGNIRSAGLTHVAHVIAVLHWGGTVRYARLQNHEWIILTRQNLNDFPHDQRGYIQVNNFGPKSRKRVKHYLETELGIDPKLDLTGFPWKYLV